MQLAEIPFTVTALSFLVYISTQNWQLYVDSVPV